MIDNDSMRKRTPPRRWSVYA